MAEYLFVYGTLKREQSHHALVSDCRFAGVAHMPGSLYELPHGFPAAVCEGVGSVEGELYELPDYGQLLLQELDDYEDVPTGLFVRERVRVRGREVWAYIAGPALRSELEGLRPLPGGRWPR